MKAGGESGLAKLEDVREGGSHGNGWHFVVMLTQNHAESWANRLIRVASIRRGPISCKTCCIHDGEFELKGVDAW